MKTKGVVVPRRILEAIQRERARRLPCETGGFLMGKRRGEFLEITDLTRQMRKDVATRATFARRDKAHQQVMQHTWRRDRTVGLIGDWHTHPVGGAAPSSMDLHAWQTLTRAVRGEAVGIILGEAVGRIFVIDERGGPTIECALDGIDDQDLVYKVGES